MKTGHRSPATYFEGKGTPVNHIDFTEPYSRTLRTKLTAAAKACGEAVTERGVYAATQGPRLETAAEIDRLERDGADLVVAKIGRRKAAGSFGKIPSFFQNVDVFHANANWTLKSDRLTGSHKAAECCPAALALSGVGRTLYTLGISPAA